MEVKVYKDVRNKANRITNCETANIDKTVSSASAQIADIRYIYEQGEADLLPPDLYEMAEVRLGNPEGVAQGIGRAAVGAHFTVGGHHRLRRLGEWAENLRHKAQREG